MFLFKRKIKVVDSGFFDGFVDHHSHIVPGVDDGVQQLDQSLKILNYFESLGVRKVIFTPHMMSDLHTDPALIDSRYAELSSSYSGSISHSLAGEYMLDSGYRKLFGEGARLLTDSTILVETSYVSPPNNMDDLLYETISTGVSPLIAHPERYTYMDKSDYDQLICNGYGLQLNLLSLSGYYGKQVVDKALYLLEKGAYTCVGSDIHSLDRFAKWVSAIKLTTKQLDCLCAIKSGLF